VHSWRREVALPVDFELEERVGKEVGDNRHRPVRRALCM
jgi:hypothetical protein